MTKTWDDAERFLVAEAERDLADTPMVRPCLLAFRRDEQVAIAFLRDFEKGEYHDAIIELLALVCPLGADRLALSVSGRATSFDDPIPPVVPGIGDMRQRVMVIHFADRFVTPQVTTVVHPFDLDRSNVRWGEPMRDLGPAEGWIGGVLGFAVGEGYGQINGSDDDIRIQLRRCTKLGHMVGLGAAVARRLGLVPAE